LNETVSLAGLFASSFLSSTLLPGSSEAVLAAILITNTAGWWPTLAVATLGNTLGGLTTYALGRLAPEPQAKSRTAASLKHYGAPVLLLSWLPVVGDGLCLAAGWLRLRFWQCAAFMAVGKFARYWLLASLVRGVPEGTLR
jgi:membrane protein YqaA with SNARE-associated domain